MSKTGIIPHDVISGRNLPEVTPDHILVNGDPVEIDGEMYFVCEANPEINTDGHSIDVIPLIVRNPANIPEIGKYINCLSIAHRRVQFINKNGKCDLKSCDEMIIS